MRISVITSSRLLLAAPSVPTPTRMPRSRIAATGAMPLASLRFDDGQCATRHALARHEVELVVFQVHRSARR